MEDFREKICGKTTAEMERQPQQTVLVAWQCKGFENGGIGQEHVESNC
jgi:hypothetical protein